MPAVLLLKVQESTVRVMARVGPGLQEVLVNSPVVLVEMAPPLDEVELLRRMERRMVVLPPVTAMAPP